MATSFASFRRRFWLAVPAIALSLNVWAGPTYTVINLGTLGAESEALAISNNGYIVGDSYDPAQQLRATLFTPGAAPSAFQVFSSQTLFSRAFGINDSGHAVGIAVAPAPLSDCCIHATLFTPSGPPVDLGTLGGSSSTAFGINNAGQVIGISSTSGDQNNFATLFSANASPVSLGAIGNQYSVAFAINDVGQAVGYSGVNQQFSFATLFNIGGNPVFLGMGAALGINNSGQIVGTSSETRHATLFSANGAPVDLGTLSGSTSTARAINESGLIVGDAVLAGNAVAHAAIFSTSGSPIDLNDLIDPLSGWELMYASDVNDAGQIIGFGVIGGQYRAFLATPVPEPGTLALIAIGLISVRRRTKK